PESVDALIPGRLIRRCIATWPITIGERGRHVAGVTRKLQDVPLCDPHMLQEAPGRVRHARRFAPSQHTAQTPYRLLETNVSVSSPEQIQHVFPQGLVTVHGMSPCRRKSQFYGWMARASESARLQMLSPHGPFAIPLVDIILNRKK